jgi:hypothetical protein
MKHKQKQSFVSSRIMSTTNMNYDSGSKIIGVNTDKKLFRFFFYFLALIFDILNIV